MFQLTWAKAHYADSKAFSLYISTRSLCNRRKANALLDQQPCAILVFDDAPVVAVARLLLFLDLSKLIHCAAQAEMQ